MIVSWKWLKDYLHQNVSADEVTRRLMLAGLNHEGTTPVGDDLAIDLEVTSNRPDCLGHLGIAREISVLFDTPLKVPAAEPNASGSSVANLASVQVLCPDLCPRYTARIIQGVRVGPSPAWLVDRLATIYRPRNPDWKPVNNIVDITNYVLMECGQPLHAFDMKCLRGGQIIVRPARAGEKFTAINHKTYELSATMCVIADAQRPVALGGVMGGEDSEVSARTTDLLIESARFSPLSIRHTARTLGLHSDSSYRFERGVDPGGVDWASRRCCELILEIAGGTLACGVLDSGQDDPPRTPIVLRLSQLPRILGIEVPQPEVLRILSALGNRVLRSNEHTIEVVPPSWRGDLEREIDLVEEVARVHGYDQIPEDVSVPMAVSSRSDGDRVLSKVRQVMTAAGFNEAMSASAVTDELSDAFSPWSDRPPLRAATPVIERATTLRRSLIPSLLAARRTNETLGNARIELFEIARVYLPCDAPLPVEELMLGLTSGGDFFHVKGILEALVAALNPAAALTATPLAEGEPVRSLLGPRSAWLHVDGQQLGVLGSLHAAGAERFELRASSTIAELKLAVLQGIARLIPQYARPPEFPAIVLDVNLILPHSVRWADLAAVVNQRGGPHLESAQYRETYCDDRLAAQGKKKILFQLTLRSADGTLTHEQASAARQAIFETCVAKFGAAQG
jgi:phenylalanyl-tRNA synthetase beta chain